MITVVANNAAEKAVPRPFVHGRLGYPERRAHFLSRKQTSFAQTAEPALEMVDHANPFDLLPGERQVLPRPESLLVQHLSHFAIAVLVEQTIDLSDDRWFGFAN